MLKRVGWKSKRRLVWVLASLRHVFICLVQNACLSISLIFSVSASVLPKFFIKDEERFVNVLCLFLLLLAWIHSFTILIIVVLSWLAEWWLTDTGTCWIPSALLLPEPPSLGRCDLHWSKFNLPTAFSLMYTCPTDGAILKTVLPLPSRTDDYLYHLSNYICSFVHFLPDCCLKQWQPIIF